MEVSIQIDGAVLMLFCETAGIDYDNVSFRRVVDDSMVVFGEVAIDHGIAEEIDFTKPVRAIDIHLEGFDHYN